MKALLWKGYGVSDIYIVNDNNFELVKSTVLGIIYSYEKEDILSVEDTEYWYDLVETVRELTYGDDSFESFEIVDVQE